MRYFIVDAFAENVFKGNQAGVCLVTKPIEDSVMQSIAAENNLAETAFIFPKKDREKGDYDYELRWFTPEMEIDLCGHATLASAFVITNYVNKDAGVVRFNTMSGVLTVTQNGDLFEMDFPSRKPEKIEVMPCMEEALGVPVLEAYLSRDMVFVVKDEKTVSQLKPKLDLIAEIPNCFAAVVTAKGDEVDFVSRFFAPEAGIAEDPVTGSSHATLIPFWSERLGKKEMIAKQLSKRGGTLWCKDCGERVKISGKACIYLQGDIQI